jgi:hypothetical protein
MGSVGFEADALVYQQDKQGVNIERNVYRNSRAKLELGLGKMEVTRLGSTRQVDVGRAYHGRLCELACILTACQQ